MMSGSASLSPYEQALLMISQWQRQGMLNQPQGNGLLPSNAFDNLKGGNPPTLQIPTKPFGSLSGPPMQVAGNANPGMLGPNTQSNYNGPEAWTGRPNPTQQQGPQPMQIQPPSQGGGFNWRDLLKLSDAGGDPSYG